MHVTQYFLIIQITFIYLQHHVLYICTKFIPHRREGKERGK